MIGQVKNSDREKQYGLLSNKGIYQVKPSAININILDYVQRVESDGGQVEAQDYVSEIITGLTTLYISNILGDYVQRVESDGGVVESQSYVLQTITDLN